MSKLPHLLALLALSAATTGYSEDKPYIAVGSAKTKKTVIAIAPIQADPMLRNEAKQVVETVNSDLKFMDLFRFLEPAAFIEGAGAGISPGTFKMTDWSSIGAEFVAKSAMTREGGNIRLEGYLYDTFGSKQLFTKRYLAAQQDSKAASGAEKKKSTS